MKIRWWLIGLCTLLLCGCNPVKKAARHNIPLLQEKHWHLTAIQKDTLWGDYPQSAYIVFQPDGKFTGYTGCNTFFGTYYQRKMKLQISYEGATKRLCDEQMYLEEQMLKYLKMDIQHFTILDSVLYLYAGKEEVLRFN